MGLSLDHSVGSGIGLFMDPVFLGNISLNPMIPAFHVPGSSLHVSGPVSLGSLDLKYHACFSGFQFQFPSPMTSVPFHQKLNFFTE